MEIQEIQQLVEKWEKVEGPLSIKDIADSDVKANLACLMENQEKARTRSLNETSDGFTTGAVAQTNAGLDGAFSPMALALVRRSFPDLFANKIVGVQAMSGPVGLAYALRINYKDAGNSNVTEVEAAFDKVDVFSGFTGSTSGTSGTADAGTGVSTATGEAWLIGGAMPELAMKIDKVAIEAKTRKLAASYSLEVAQDVRAMHGIDVSKEMTAHLKYEIQAELDRELLASVKSVAATAAAINMSGTAIDGRWSQEKYVNLVNKIIKEANNIGQRTRRGVGNFCVVSTNVATAIQAVSNGYFSANTQMVNPSSTFAEIGKINGTITVFRDTYNTDDSIVVGYKGPGISDAGVIFSPYIMGLFNQAVSPNDFAPRIGVMSRYAITSSLLGASRYYTKFNVSNLSSVLA